MDRKSKITSDLLTNSPMLTFTFEKPKQARPANSLVSQKALRANMYLEKIIKVLQSFTSLINYDTFDQITEVSSTSSSSLNVLIFKDLNFIKATGFDEKFELEEITHPHNNLTNSRLCKHLYTIVHEVRSHNTDRPVILLLKNVALFKETYLNLIIQILVSSAVPKLLLAVESVDVSGLLARVEQSITNKLKLIVMNQNVHIRDAYATGLLYVYFDVSIKLPFSLKAFYVLIDNLKRNEPFDTLRKRIEEYVFALLFEKENKKITESIVLRKKLRRMFEEKFGLPVDNELEQELEKLKVDEKDNSKEAFYELERLELVKAVKYEYLLEFVRTYLCLENTADNSYEERVTPNFAADVVKDLNKFRNVLGKNAKFDISNEPTDENCELDTMEAIANTFVDFIEKFENAPEVSKAEDFVRSSKNIGNWTDIDKATSKLLFDFHLHSLIKLRKDGQFVNKLVFLGNTSN